MKKKYVIVYISKVDGYYGMTEFIGQEGTMVGGVNSNIYIGFGWWMCYLAMEDGLIRSFYRIQLKEVKS